MGFPSAEAEAAGRTVALHFLKCGRIFRFSRRPYLHNHHSALHHVTAETWRDTVQFPYLLAILAAGAFWVMLLFPKPRERLAPSVWPKRSNGRSSILGQAQQFRGHRSARESSTGIIFCWTADCYVTVEAWPTNYKFSPRIRHTRDMFGLSQGSVIKGLNSHNVLVWT